MITFVISLIVLVIGGTLYSKYLQNQLMPDDRLTPAVRLNDGVDFLPMKNWKIFMIQFLNIAGTGPIFGAIMGAKFGPAAYLWIVFGCIFAGAMHDYISGHISIRNKGFGLPETIGRYLGGTTRTVMLIFTVFLLLMVGAVFVYSPAQILGNMISGGSTAEVATIFGSTMSETEVWILRFCFVIIVYYLIATMLPIDKLIGRIYPFFAIALLFMAVALCVYLFVHWPSLPEITNIADTWTLSPGDIFPALFITIACGAISGFHATQSPLMARCMTDERKSRSIFYGAMITEGVVALIWATVSMYFFYGGAGEALGVDISKPVSAPAVVDAVSWGWLGTFGGILAILGVVAAPITTGDTALRSCRIIVAEFVKFKQKTINSRLIISIPIFIIVLGLLAFSIENPSGFDTIWQYFGWANQALSVFTLWAITVYLTVHHKPFLISLVPAIFMTTICTAFILTSKNAFDLPMTVGVVAGLSLSFVFFAIFASNYKRLRHRPKSSRLRRLEKKLKNKKI